jgi:hypothetical protein
MAARRRGAVHAELFGDVKWIRYRARAPGCQRWTGGGDGPHDSRHPRGCTCGRRRTRGHCRRAPARSSSTMGRPRARSIEWGRPDGAPATARAWLQSSASRRARRLLRTTSIRAAKPLLARLLHRQSMGALSGRAAFPSHGLRSRIRLLPTVPRLPPSSSARSAPLEPDVSARGRHRGRWPRNGQRNGHPQSRRPGAGCHAASDPV